MCCIVVPRNMDILLASWLNKCVEMAVKLKERCSRIDFKVPCLIIGYFGAAVSAICTLALFLSVAAFVYCQQNRYWFHYWIRDHLPPDLSQSYYLTDWIIGFGLGASILGFVFCTMYLGFYITLLVGVHKKEPKHLNTWLTFKTIVIVANLLNVILLMVFGATTEALIVFGCNLLIWAVVKRHFNQLKIETATESHEVCACICEEPEEPLKVALSDTHYLIEEPLKVALGESKHLIE